jgi:hypothetical protein
MCIIRPLCCCLNRSAVAGTHSDRSLDHFEVAKRLLGACPGLATSCTSSLASQRTLSGQLNGSHLPATLQIQKAQCVNKRESFGDEAQGSDGSGESSPTGCCPPHGAKAVCGKRTAMEDAFAVQPDLLSVPFTQEYQMSPDVLPTRIALKYKENTEFCCDVSAASMSSTTSSSSSGSSSSSNSSCTETFHFFGVYDGHGGSQAANHCAHRLHYHLSDALATYLTHCSSQCSNDLPGPGIPESGSVTQKLPQLPEEDMDPLPELPSLSEFEAPPLVEKPALELSSSLQGLSELPVAMGCDKVEEWVGSESAADRPAAPEALDDLDCPCPDSIASSPDHPCFSKVFEEALKQAFIKTDAEFGTDECSALVGSTAVVALVGGTKYCIANCGKLPAAACLCVHACLPVNQLSGMCSVFLQIPARIESCVAHSHG